LLEQNSFTTTLLQKIEPMFGNSGKKFQAFFKQ
jgi:hypothetical protein